MKLLLVEDEDDLREVVEEYLETFGFEVDTAENGQQALDRLHESAYDGIVMDIMMPVMDGLEALKHMRMEGNKTPVLMLTAKAELDDRVGGLEAGADDYLTKPFALKELLARVRSMVRRKQEYMPKLLNFRNTTLNIDNGTLKAVNSISLANREVRLLELLIQNPGKEFGHEELYEMIWKDDEEATPDTARMYLAFVRSKLNAVSSEITIEKTAEGKYRLL